MSRADTTTKEGGRMTTRRTRLGSLTDEQIHSVLTAATAAPSLHNSQPWHFRCTHEAIELYADTTRAVSGTDPDHRELLLACGAALLNLRLAIRALGVHPAVQLIPDPNQPDLLAIVRLQGPSPARPVDRRLAEALRRRRTNIRQVVPTTVPVPLLNELRQAAKTEQSWMATLAPAQLPILHTLLAQAHDTQQHNPPFVAKWSHWAGRDPDSTDGVPAFEPGPMIAVIGSFHDLPLAHLQAGQAMQRVLLVATIAGLSVSLLSQVVAVPPTRKQLRELIGGGLWPQVVLRLGYGSPMAPTPRCDIDDTEVSIMSVGDHGRL
jgi:nitroreductase